jgi:enoyl-CoA hydratase
LNNRPSVSANLGSANRVSVHGEGGLVAVDEAPGGEGIFIVTMSHPELNILSLALMGALAEAFDAINALQDPDPNNDRVRAVILRSDTRAFTVGLDIGTLAGDYLDAGLPPKIDPFRAMWECPFPIIGAVNGAAVTGGFEIALCCDVLLASPRAVFLDNHPKYGVHPGRRLSQRLIQLCGVNNAKLATLASYPIEADLAQRWGLVQQVFETNEELEREALAVAGMMSRNHPVMVKRYKDLIERGAAETYREGIGMEEASEATYYGTLTDVDATLKDGAEKFQDMLRWVASRP